MVLEIKAALDLKVSEIRPGDQGKAWSIVAGRPTDFFLHARQHKIDQPHRGADQHAGRTTIEQSGGEMLISADHGNFEQMVADDGEPHTQHTVGPVPLVYLGRKATLAHGALRDLAPTVLALMALPQPAEMTGHALVTFG